MRTAPGPAVVVMVVVVGSLVLWTAGGGAEGAEYWLLRTWGSGF